MYSASQGDKALAESNCPQAIYHYTHALTEHPRAPHYFIQRSTAFSRLKPTDGGPKYSAALRDAEIALALARERGKRELILAAQMRRGVALYQLERYGDAAFVFETVEAKIGPGNKAEQDKSEGVKAAMANSGQGGKKAGAGSELSIWMVKVRRKLAELGDGDQKAVVSVVEHPGDIRVPTEKELKAEWEALQTGKTVEEATAAPSISSTKTATEQPVTPGNQTGASGSVAAVSTPAAPEKIRHEWYQSQDKIVVTLYVKGITRDSVEVDLQESSASLQFPLPSGSEYAFTLDPLYAPIDASGSKVSVMSTKIEISLQKQAPGQKWGALESSSSADAPKLADRSAVSAGSGISTSSSGPAYPTSSPHGVKDWDKVTSTLTQKKSKGKGKEKAEEGKKNGNDDNGGDESDGAESVDSELGGDAVDGFFKKLYANADPDTRRAMVKSYVESQGTSLSTNWQEVSKGKMEVRPPS